MANIEILEDRANEIQQVVDTYEEHIEVVEQSIDQTMTADMKDFIFESPLPTYIPSVPAGYEIEQFYGCKECGDQFIAQGSYQFHMERRSLLIKYDCSECKTSITVYNRCSLLSHLRQHGDPSLQSTLDTSQLLISPIPVDKMLIGTLSDTNAGEGSPLNRLQEIPLGNEEKYCTECNTEVKGESREHFQGSGNGIPIDHSHKCKFCHMVLATKCSLRAHERYHRQERPYVCPDCAKVFGLWASFSVHLSYCCYHLDKCIQYKCPACKACFTTSVALEVHILTMHVKNVFKCNACPIACFSLQALEVHKMKGHGQPGLPTNAYQQCQLCPDRLIPKSRLLFHVIEHVRKPTVCVYGYQCNGCKVFCQKKSDFAAHKAQCTEQLTSASVDIKNGVIVKLKNIDNVLNPTLLNGSQCTPIVADASATSQKDSHQGKNNLKAPTPQSKSNSITTKTSEVTCNGGNVNKGEKKGADESASPSEVTVTVTDTVTVTAEDAEEPTPQENSTKIIGEMSHLCDGCGCEFTCNPDGVNNTDDSIRCTNCSTDSHNGSKTRSRKNATRTETLQKDKTNRSSKGSTTVVNGSKVQTLPKRRRNSITINGPGNKKAKLPINSTDISDKDKYKCHICKTDIGTEWEVIQDHFAKEHKNFNLLVFSPRINKLETSNTNVSEKNASNNVTRSNSCKNIRIKTEPIEEKESENNQETQKSKRSKKKVSPKEKTKDVPLGSGQLISAQSQKNADGIYTCFKCKYTNCDVETFWSHIVTHKTDSRAYQCMECGMCFVVKPSFQKHLFISHRIKDVDKYIEDHQLCHQKPKRNARDEADDPASPGIDDKEELEENQCRVCRAKFDTAVQLNKHFRTHGMAFLMMKQQEIRNAPSNS